ncbi:MAG: alpha/beta fold hydrolase [Anaerorhabdus sp.]|uniref:alpha/beta hydrolase n=1 Tax=Anaerorhabdus sp. TaxID=1872524 RepID=UPI002B1FDB32|nr:alpha/beta fold hydrolase [Anaerorhabdus sp.]MEA4875740.1 alpha/beta fold hydrolase [Anaerorhabdus sp.]
MLKKISKVLLLCALVLVTGCTKKEPVIELTDENIKAISVEVADAFVNSEFKNIPQYLSKEAKEEITLQNLTQSWNKVTENLGSYQTMKIDVHRLADRDLGYVYMTFKSGTVKLSLSFNQEMKIKGMYLNYPSKIVEAVNTDEYTEQNVLVGVDEMINGILTLPVGVDNPPVAILVQGSGVSNLNEEAYAMKPFEDIAHGLAKEGIATIRYDKRYYGYPEWDGIREVSLNWEYLYDFASVIHQLEDMPVNHNQIYVIGHSQGGMLAPRLAYDHPEVKGIISLAGTPRGLEEVMKDQQYNAVVAQGSNEQMVQGVVDLADKVIAEIQSLTKETATDKVVNSYPLSYWYELNQSRPYIFMNELKCDVLILQGESDFQVFYDKDYQEWMKLTSGMDNVQMKSYPGLSHFFTPAINNTVEDYKTPANVDEKVIQDMASWILNRKVEKGK